MTISHARFRYKVNFGIKMNIANLLIRARNQPIKSRLYQGVNALLVWVAGKSIKVSHVLEYPKCGGTWVRNMVQTYLGGEPYYADRILKPKNVIHLHRKYSDRFSYPVVLFRDPRDAYTSFYFYEKTVSKEKISLAINKYIKFSDTRDVKEEFADYLNAKLSQVTDPYFTYKDFIDSWFKKKDVCFVFYENFKKTPEKELAKIIEFIGEKIDTQRLAYAIEYNSFENVTNRKYGIGKKPGEDDSSKFQRKGVIGDWVNCFNSEACSLIAAHMGDELIKLGYENSKDWATRINK